MKKMQEIVSRQCKICEAPALHSNYGAMTCGSCKIFFRRTQAREQKNFRCQSDDNCEINIYNRHICTSCRFAKCLANGMQSDLIRSARSKNHPSTQKTETTTTSSNILIPTGQKEQQQQLAVLNLLRSDNSTLDSNQWTLLSNLVYNYDEKKLLSIAEQFMNETNAIQPLTTIDPTLPKEFFMKIYETSEGYLRSNPDLCTLSSNERSDFLRNAADNVTCLGAVLSWSWSQIYNYKPFIQVFQNNYGDSPLTMIQSVLKFIDPDIVVAKLSLSLFAFSNNISLFLPHIIPKSINAFEVFHIQNIYAEVTWKYLLYKYGYNQSIQRFIKLIQCLLAAINIVFDGQNIAKHLSDMQLLVEQTELTLVLDDLERID